ncbi:general transcription factor II-I repeat domain-containing protein 2-like [Palaemon carinicauda]|uniref:general transcription factor II-I repeat domain-containing protein 2-like n=1 Tax=Palaemon carinicauda TaxID=392227 RepID=UPI0035B5D512
MDSCKCISSVVSLGFTVLMYSIKLTNVPRTIYNVRWLSKGKVLERFWAIRKELQTSLEDQNSVKAKAFSEFLKDDKKIESVGILPDIMSHLNDLNIKLQGEKHTISNLISAIRAFQKKKWNFSRTILRANFSIFQDLEERKDETDTKYDQFIEKLINNFKVRFDDFVLGKQLLLFIQNPFLVTDITELSVEANLTWKWVDAAKIQLELIDFQENVALKQVFCDCTPETFWSKEGSPANFPTLHRLAVQILTMFGSSYCCESAFSTAFAPDHGTSSGRLSSNFTNDYVKILNYY